MEEIEGKKRLKKRNASQRGNNVRPKEKNPKGAQLMVQEIVKGELSSRQLDENNQKIHILDQEACMQSSPPWGSTHTIRVDPIPNPMKGARCATCPRQDVSEEPNKRKKHIKKIILNTLFLSHVFRSLLSSFFS